MPNWSKVAYCPYYKSQSSISITCEGIINGFDMIKKFKNTDEKDIYMAEHCCKKGYGMCACAKILDRKYFS